MHQQKRSISKSRLKVVVVVVVVRLFKAAATFEKQKELKDGLRNSIFYRRTEHFEPCRN
jgi:hypothetical protein